MALGDFLLGEGPLGFDPIASNSPAGVRQQRAPLIHPGLHDAVLLEDGSLLGVHPVDQEVALALGVARGTLGSAPDQGHSLGELEYGARDLEAQVQQRVEQALAVLLARGDVLLVSVVTTLIEGGFVVDATYQNLRLLPVREQSLRLRST